MGTRSDRRPQWPAKGVVGNGRPKGYCPSLDVGRAPHVPQAANRPLTAPKTPKPTMRRPIHHSMAIAPVHKTGTQEVAPMHHDQHHHWLRRTGQLIKGVVVQFGSRQRTREDCTQDHTLQSVIDMEAPVFSSISCFIASPSSVQKQPKSDKIVTFLSTHPITAFDAPPPP